MSSIASPRFYVYILVRPNGKAFYVGKGKGRRVFKHEAEARRGHECHKCSIIRKIWRQGGEVQRYIMLETDDEQEAFSYEVELIATYRRGELVNRTGGGEGASHLSLEARAKLSAAMKARYADPEARAKTGAAVRAQLATHPRKKVIKVLKYGPGKPRSAELKAKQSVTMKAIWKRRKEAQADLDIV